MLLHLGDGGRMTRSSMLSSSLEWVQVSCIRRPCIEDEEEGGRERRGGRRKKKWRRGGWRKGGERRSRGGDKIGHALLWAMWCSCSWSQLGSSQERPLDIGHRGQQSTPKHTQPRELKLHFHTEARTVPVPRATHPSADECTGSRVNLYKGIWFSHRNARSWLYASGLSTRNLDSIILRKRNLSYKVSHVQFHVYEMHTTGD